MPFKGISSSDIEIIPPNHRSTGIRDYRGHEEDAREGAKPADSSAGGRQDGRGGQQADARLPQQPTKAQGEKGDRVAACYQEGIYSSNGIVL